MLLHLFIVLLKKVSNAESMSSIGGVILSASSDVTPYPLMPQGIIPEYSSRFGFTLSAMPW